MDESVKLPSGVVVTGGTDKQREVLRKRGEFVRRYCAAKGWSFAKLTIEQLLEIRKQPEWMTMENTRIEERKIENFIARYRENLKAEQIDNGSLRAGAPMYFYCKACLKHIATLPENYTCPTPQRCEDCEDLKKLSLLDEALKRARKAQ
jgi:hypothetical protein